LSPILVRPVREQLEHDRVIRLLQAKYKRKYEVAINPGNEQTMGVGTGPSPWYPDLVLQTADRNHKLAGVVEVETAESVNNLEAMSQWATFARLRVPFHLYLPTSAVDSARRFCADLSIPVAELWAYQAIGDQLRFTLVQRAQGSDGGSRSTGAEPAGEARPRRSGRAAAAAGGSGAHASPRSRAAASGARANGQGPRRPAVRSTSSPAAAKRRPATAKPKAAAPRRPAAKAPARRKTKAAASRRPQKRR
jgi:hypothetical protein